MNKIYKIKKEYCEEGEENILYKIVEQRGERVLISPIKSNMAIIPIETVKYEYLREVVL